MNEWIYLILHLVLNLCFWDNCSQWKYCGKRLSHFVKKEMKNSFSLSVATKALDFPSRQISPSRWDWISGKFRSALAWYSWILVSCARFGNVHMVCRGSHLTQWDVWTIWCTQSCPFESPCCSRSPSSLMSPVLSSIYLEILSILK